MEGGGKTKKENIGLKIYIYMCMNDRDNHLSLPHTLVIGASTSLSNEFVLSRKPTSSSLCGGGNAVGATAQPCSFSFGSVAFDNYTGHDYFGLKKKKKSKSNLRVTHNSCLD